LPKLNINKDLQICLSAYLLLKKDLPHPFLFSAYKTAKQGVLDIEGVNSLSVSYSSVDERRRAGEEKLE